MAIDSTFWTGKRVFLTGHTGFKGAWLALWLQRLGADVTGYALAPPSEPNLFTLSQVAQAVRSLTGDIRDLRPLQSAMTAQRPDIVIHMAAQSLVRASYADPIGTYSTNVMGTVNVLEAARAADGVKAIVVVTSDKCYDNKEQAAGYREQDPMGGSDPYSSSKGCTELVTMAYRRSFLASQRVAVASARAGNVIGGGDWAADRLIPDVVNPLMQNKPVIIRNPHSIRPWQHVLDPLAGYLLLAEKLCGDADKFADAWNFGPNEEDAKPVSWVVDTVTRLWGQGANWTTDDRTHPHEARYLKLNSGKARQSLQWAPKLAVTTALEWTVEWYKAYQNGANMRDTTLAQLERYQRLSST